MRQTLLIFLFSSISYFGFSQYMYDESRVKYDSLHKALKVAKADTTKITILAELAQYHKFSRADSGIYYATKAISLARSMGYLNPEPRALFALASSYSTLGDYAKASRINMELLKIAEQKKDDIFRASVYSSLGNINRQLGNYKVALEFSKNSYSLLKIIGGDLLFAISGVEVSRVFLEMNQPDSALWYVYQTKEIADVKKITSFPYVQLGRIHRRLGNLDSALYYSRKSYSLVGSSETARANRAMELARTFMAQYQMDSSRFYAHHALQTAVDYRLYRDIVSSNLLLSDLYEQDDPRLSLKHSRMAIAYSDSLSTMSYLSSFEDFKDYDEQQRQFELESAEREYKSRIRTNILLGITFTVLVIAFILYRNSKQKQKAKQKIELAYDQLKSTQSQLIQSEKMASLGELTAGIAHEIQNPLNFVNNFSEVNTELIKEIQDERRKTQDKRDEKLEDELLNDIAQNQEKVLHHGKRADAIVKGMLQHSRSSSGVKEPTNINALADEYLRLAYHGLRAKDKSFNAILNTEYDQAIGNINIIPQDIGRVILNLINNAFYSVNEKLKAESLPDRQAGSKRNAEEYEPTVSVTTKKEGNRVLISVKDNGNGIPQKMLDKIFQPFFTTKPTGQGTGLGLSLSYDIVKAHGGELSVESNEGTGAIFTLQLHS